MNQSSNGAQRSGRRRGDSNQAWWEEGEDQSGHLHTGGGCVNEVKFKATRSGRGLGSEKSKDCTDPEKKPRSLQRAPETAGPARAVLVHARERRRELGDGRTSI